jgi:hypothetical protein
VIDSPRDDLIEKVRYGKMTLPRRKQRLRG